MTNPLFVDTFPKLSSFVEACMSTKYTRQASRQGEKCKHSILGSN